MSNEGDGWGARSIYRKLTDCEVQWNINGRGCVKRGNIDRLATTKQKNIKIFFLLLQSTSTIFRSCERLAKAALGRWATICYSSICAICALLICPFILFCILIFFSLFVFHFHCLFFFSLDAHRFGLLFFVFFLNKKLALYRFLSISIRSAFSSSLGHSLRRVFLRN